MGSPRMGSKYAGHQDDEVKKRIEFEDSHDSDIG